MKANQLFDKILEKWPVKVGCLIVAICLYLFHQASLTDKRSFVIPLQVIEEGAVMHIGDFTSNVTVTVRANTDQISAVHSNQLNAYINLNSIVKKGEYTLPVKIDVSDELLAFDPFEITVKPENIKLHVENKDMKFIPLEPSIVGEPAHGYEVTSVKIVPSELEVMGPESLIEYTQKLYTEKIDVEGLTQKTEYEVQYRTVNKLLTILDEGPYQVVVNIEPALMERTINDIAVNVLSLSDKFYLKDDVQPVSVTLEGTVPVLENYSPAKRFVTLDLQKITEPGEYDLPLVYSVPSYLALVESSQQVVHVVVLAKEEESEEIELGPEVNE